ncbi:hypothetical protein COAQ111491_02975 [Comamonas aquatilis]
MRAEHKNKWPGTTGPSALLIAKDNAPGVPLQWLHLFCGY